MLAHIAMLIAQAPKNLPDLPSRDVGTDPKPYIAVFAIGFLIAVFGHIFQVKLMVAAGVVMVFMATVVLPLVAALQG